MSIIVLRNDIFMFVALLFSIGSPTENFINNFWQEKLVC